MATRKQPGKLVVVTDQQGRVVGAAMPTKEKDMQVGMVPLEGQSLHEVELPKNLRSFTSPETLTAALDGACLTANGELNIRELKLKK
jgi:hypothetical protein